MGNKNTKSDSPPPQPTSATSPSRSSPNLAQQPSGNQPTSAIAQTRAVRPSSANAAAPNGGAANVGRPPSPDEFGDGLSTVAIYQYGAPSLLSPDVIAVVCFNFSRPPLGQGGFSTVFEGVYQSRPVAVKILAIRNPSEMQLFEAELAILLMEQLRHPHLLPLIAYCRERPALVMPRLKPLNKARLPRLPGSMRMKVAMDVAIGLAHLHNAGFVHNDMKPDNVLLEFDDQRHLIRALVGDLGCVKSVRIPVQPFGTILFMDPGLNINGPPVLPKPADDVYSFGLTIVCIFTNSFPESAQHLVGMWATIDRLFPLISALARRMTLPDPMMRPSCHQVAAELAVIDQGWKEVVTRQQQSAAAVAAAQQQQQQQQQQQYLQLQQLQHPQQQMYHPQQQQYQHPVVQQPQARGISAAPQPQLQHSGMVPPPAGAMHMQFSGDSSSSSPTLGPAGPPSNGRISLQQPHQYQQYPPSGMEGRQTSMTDV